MEVFKFCCGDLYYVYAAQTKELAIDAFNDEIGYEFTSCEEIQENEWDEKIVSIWEDDDVSKNPIKESIREIICGSEPHMIYTNDTDFI